MKCQSCGKKEATVRYKENINGKKQEIFLCESCADKMGFVNFSDLFTPMFVSIPEFFSKPEQKRCKKCGYTLENYSKTGVFGCEECYNTFEDTLDELFLKLHGKNRHIAIEKKNPKTQEEKNAEKVEELKEKIKSLIDQEKYEEAAIIRDEIKKLQGK